VIKARLSRWAILTGCIVAIRPLYRGRNPLQMSWAHRSALVSSARILTVFFRAQVMAELGVEFLYEIPFDAALRDMDDTEFVETVLHQGLGIRHVIVGEDYGFGKNRCGNVESLMRLCAERGIGVTAISPVGLHKLYGKYGSTEIRKALQDGDVFHAQHMLSRPWQVDGVVQKGQQRGRTINFPTANLDFADLVRPKFGVYVVEVRIDGEENWFRSFIRPEQKFESFDALKEQIIRDANGARAILGVKV